jgi:hypothetical protein
VGDSRWLLVRLPDNKEFCVNLDVARTDDQKGLVGRQAADMPLFSIETNDCIGEYQALKKGAASSSKENPKSIRTVPAF